MSRKVPYSSSIQAVAIMRSRDRRPPTQTIPSRLSSEITQCECD